jgi:hypothetical protein
MINWLFTLFVFLTVPPIALILACLVAFYPCWGECWSEVEDFDDREQL